MHAKKSIKFRGERASNNGFNGDHDRVLQNKLRDIGILKVSMDYDGGVNYPFGVKNIDEDDYSTWIDTVRKSPTAIKSRTKPLFKVLQHSDFYHYCTRGVMKIEEQDKIIHEKIQSSKNQGDPSKLSDEEMKEVERVVEKRSANQHAGKAKGKLPKHPIWGSLAKHPYGRKFLRKYALLRDALSYLRFKVHLIGQNDEKRAGYAASAMREFGRQEQMIWDF